MVPLFLSRCCNPQMRNSIAIRSLDALKEHKLLVFWAHEYTLINDINLLTLPAIIRQRTVCTEVVHAGMPAENPQSEAGRAFAFVLSKRASESGDISQTALRSQISSNGTDLEALQLLVVIQPSSVTVVSSRKSRIPIATGGIGLKWLCANNN